VTCTQQFGPPGCEVRTGRYSYASDLQPTSALVGVTGLARSRRPVPKGGRVARPRLGWSGGPIDREVVKDLKKKLEGVVRQQVPRRFGR
jgi:hypothetical protein